MTMIEWFSNMLRQKIYFFDFWNDYDIFSSKFHFIHSGQTGSFSPSHHQIIHKEIHLIKPQLLPNHFIISSSIQIAIIYLKMCVFIESSSICLPHEIEIHQFSSPHINHHLLSITINWHQIQTNLISHFAPLKALKVSTKFSLSLREFSSFLHCRALRSTRFVFA